MALFSNNIKTILFLKTDSLEVYDLGSGSVEKLKFSPEIVNHLEVKDITKYKTSLEKFLANLPKQDGIIVLSDSVTFQKTIDSKEEKDTQEQVNQFLSTVPFDREKIAQKNMEGKDKLLIFATNSKLYEPIVEVAQSLNWNLEQVVPLIFFTENANTLNEENVKLILADHKALEVSNFLTSESSRDESTEKEAQDEDQADQGEEEQNSENKQSFSTNKVDSKKTIISIILIIILVSFIIYQLGFLDRFLKPQEEKTSLPTENTETLKTEESTSSAVEATPSATLSKEELKIQVLNGSGVSGQAAKIQTQLQEVGFQNVDVGNASTVADKTSLQFLPTVSKEIQTEVINLLKETLLEVEASESVDLEFDIVITAGKLK